VYPGAKWTATERSAVIYPPLAEATMPDAPSELGHPRCRLGRIEAGEREPHSRIDRLRAYIAVLTGRLENDSHVPVDLSVAVSGVDASEADGIATADQGSLQPPPRWARTSRRTTSRAMKSGGSQIMGVEPSRYGLFNR